MVAVDTGCCWPALVAVDWDDMVARLIPYINYSFFNKVKGLDVLLVVVVADAILDAICKIMVLQV